MKDGKDCFCLKVQGASFLKTFGLLALLHGAAAELTGTCKKLTSPVEVRGVMQMLNWSSALRGHRTVSKDSSISTD